MTSDKIEASYLGMRTGGRVLVEVWQLLGGGGGAASAGVGLSAEWWGAQSRQYCFQLYLLLDASNRTMTIKKLKLLACTCNRSGGSL